MNLVSVKYINMKRAADVFVFKLWNEMSQLNKLKLIKQLIKFKRELFSIQLLIYDSLYFRDFCENLSRCLLLDWNIDFSKSYCMSRSDDRSYKLNDCEKWDDFKMNLKLCKYILIVSLTLILIHTFKNYIICVWYCDCKARNISCFARFIVAFRNILSEKLYEANTFSEKHYKFFEIIKLASHSHKIR